MSNVAGVQGWRNIWWKRFWGVHLACIGLARCSAVSGKCNHSEALLLDHVLETVGCGF